MISPKRVLSNAARIYKLFLRLSKSADTPDDVYHLGDLDLEFCIWAMDGVVRYKTNAEFYAQLWLLPPLGFDGCAREAYCVVSSTIEKHSNIATLLISHR